MQNYTINSGDNLWNIAKASYGDKLTSNNDIQKAVDKIVEENGIKDPNLIHVGNSIKLPEFDNIFGNKEEQEVPSNEEENVFDNFNSWVTKHASNIEAYSNVVQSGADFEAAQQIYFEKEEEIGTSFDFMQGKDVENEQDYDEQLSKLAQGEIEHKDSDGDGEVSLNEYMSDEFASSIKKLNDEIKEGSLTYDEAIEMVSETYYSANILYNIIDNSMGDDNGTLTQDEFATYYSYLDAFEGEGNESKKDGKIEIDYVDGYPMYLANQVGTWQDADDETKNCIRNVVAKLFSDEE